MTPLEGFQARDLAGRGAIVLAPDGLTWMPAPAPRIWPTLAAAGEYALRLNGWLDEMPAPDDPATTRSPLLALAVARDPDDLEADLLRILGQLAGPDDVRIPAGGVWTRNHRSALFDGEAIR